MQPNKNYLMYFPGVLLPEEKYDSKRCSLLRIGTQIVIDKVIEENGLRELLSAYFGKNLGLLLDLKALVEKKKQLQKQELIDSFEQNGRTFEEVIEYLNTAPNRAGAARQNGKRKYQRRTKKSD